MSLKSLAATVAVLLCCVAPADAQAVKLRFHDGLVTLATQNAPLRTILAEWARLGGTTITNAERVTGAPLTLELNAVPEQQAIAVLLRTVSGYMAATRPASKPGPSVFDRILILPTSSAPRNAPPMGPTARPRPVMEQPSIPIVDPNVGDDSDDQEPINPLVRPGPNGRPQPFEQPERDSGDDQTPDRTAPSAGNPFGVPAGATSRPGVVTPVPQQEPQRTQPDPEP